MNRAETATTYSLPARTQARVLSTTLEEGQAYIAQRYEDAYDRLIDEVTGLEYDLKPLLALTGAAKYAKHEEIVALTAQVKQAMRLVDLSIAHASRVYTHLVGSFDPLCHQDEDDYQVTGEMSVAEISRYREDAEAALEDAETRHEVRLALRDEAQFEAQEGELVLPREFTDEDYQEVADADRAFQRFLDYQDRQAARRSA